MKIALNKSIQGAHPLISVWDMMTQLKIGQLAATLEQLRAATKLEIPREMRPFLDCVHNLTKLLTDLSKHSEELNLVETKGRCDLFAKNLHTAFLIGLGGVDPHDLVDELEVQTEISGIEAAIRRELSAHLFVQIPSELVKYFEQTNFFGEPVILAFPSASFDIKEAAQCRVFSLNTAAVFHLMRAAEVGLRALARRHKIKMVKKKPIEYAMWGEIIKAIRDEIDKLPSIGGTPRQVKALDFYQHIILAIAAIKHLWRNPISHSGLFIKESVAIDVFGHVEDFMVRLAAYGIKQRLKK
jgi:hypothetical protein